MRRVMLAVLVLLAATGCGRYYYHKPGADFAAFSADSRTCSRKAAIRMVTDNAGLVNPELYRACMVGLGWTREQAPDPPHLYENWFRGIERERVVNVDAVPAQPCPAARC